MTTRTDTNKTQLRVSVATADYDTASQLFHELGMDMTTTKYCGKRITFSTTSNHRH